MTNIMTKTNSIMTSLVNNNTNEFIQLTQLTQIHVPSSYSEYKRMTETASIKPRIVYDTTGSLAIEPPRYVFTSDKGGYSHDDLDCEYWSTKLTDFECKYSSKITRSFGDYHLSNYGIISTPDIVVQTYNNNNILIINSPELWKMFTKHEFKLLFNLYDFNTIINIIKEKNINTNIVIIMC